MSLTCIKSHAHKLVALVAFAAMLPVAQYDATAQPVLELNPYEGVNWERFGQYKANLHTHTTQSDGAMDPARVIDEYHARDYDILALTDHNLCTWPWTEYGRVPEELGMLAVPGNELSRHHHALSLFCEVEPPERDLHVVLDAVRAAGGLAALCHPAMHWPRTFREVPGLQVALAPALRGITQGDFTIEAWFRTTDPGRNIIMGSFSVERPGSLNLELHTDNRVRVHVQPVEGRTVDINIPAADLGVNTRDGHWHHLAGVRRGDTVYLYLDGQLAGERADTAGRYDLQGDLYYIGRDTRTDATTFNGDLDHVRLWARGLSAEEIAALAQGRVPGQDDGPAADGLLAQYAFEHAEGEPVTPGTAVRAQVDDTGGHPDGPFPAVATPRGAPTYVDDVPDALREAGASRHALRFAAAVSGEAPSLQIGLTPALRSITQGDFTLEAWFRTTDAGRNVIMGNYAGRYDGSLNLELHTDNRVRLWVQPVEGRVTDINIRADVLDINTRDGQWHHLAGVRRGDTVYLYLDGRPAGTRPDTAGAYDLQGEAYFIGRDTRTRETNFRGDLDNARLWTRGLSAEEVAALARGALPGQEGGPSAEGLLAQYLFEESGAQPVRPSAPATGPADDSAGRPEGPFHASPAPTGAPVYISEAPDALQQAGISRHALRFQPDEETPEVPAVVVDHYAEIYRRHPHLVGIEVLNGTRPLREYAMDRELWDKLLTQMMPHRPIWGFSVDDMHGMAHLGRDWKWFLAPELDEAAVRESLVNGAFYFATIRLHPPDQRSVEGTPRIVSITHDPQASIITINATVGDEPLPRDACVWISEGREVHVGPSLDYRNTEGIGVYVRAELTGNGGTAFTNPFGFRRN